MKTGAVLCLAFLAGWPLASPAQNVHTLPLVLGAENAGLTSLVRIVNHAEQAGDVQIHGIDDSGRRAGPVTLSIGAGASVNFDSRDLELGNASKGLPSGVGNGEGNWRLELTTALDIQPLAYIRTAEGFVTSMHDVAPVAAFNHSVPFFNPGSNTRQVSRLRLINRSTWGARVNVAGIDDAGDAAPGGTVTLTLPAGASRTLTAQELEAGGHDLHGSLGDGVGKWRLSVTTNVAIEVMSLLASPTGHLANVSTVPEHEGGGEPPEPPGRRFRDCPECPEMVEVPAGSFLMGSPESEGHRLDSEGPVHRVTIARPFAVGVYEVTFDEWDACVSGGGCRGGSGFSQRGRRPAVFVTWNYAQAYVRWLSRKTGAEYRLLSESEWEYVARAGATTPFHTGASITPAQANYNGSWRYLPRPGCDPGNYRDCYFYGNGVYRGQALPVGAFAPNAFGLYDVHGNVNEWVEDCWNGSYRDAPVDGSAWTSGNCFYRVLRGGAFNDAPAHIRAAKREASLNISLRIPEHVLIGFRVARTLSP